MTTTINNITINVPSTMAGRAINPDTHRADLMVDYERGYIWFYRRHKSENAVTVREAAGMIRRVELPAVADDQSLARLIAELIPHVSVVRDGIDYDSDRRKAVFDDEAEAALEVIDKLLLNVESMAADDGIGYIQPGDWLELIENEVLEALEATSVHELAVQYVEEAARENMFLIEDEMVAYLQELQQRS